jgi:hypothetical protein
MVMINLYGLMSNISDAARDVLPKAVFEHAFILKPIPGMIGALI